MPPIIPAISAPKKPAPKLLPTQAPIAHGASAEVLIPLNIRQIHLLPFHQYGEPKYRLLGKTWSMKEVPAPSSADVATMREMAERAGLQVTVGG